MPLLAEKAQLAADRTRSFARTPYAPIVAVYVALRVIAAVGIPALHHPDSASWLRVSFAGSEIRLWTVPLFFKVLPNDALRVAGQVTLSTVCWVAPIHQMSVAGFSVANILATRSSCAPGTPDTRSTSSGVHLSISLRTSSMP